jgi:hypothetical protein
MRLQTRAGFIAAALLLTTGCGVRLGYRGSYARPSDSGVYGGAWLQYAVNTAAKRAPTGSGFAVVETSYQFAPGPDFASVGGGFASAPGATGWHNTVTFQIAWEMFHGTGLHVSLCDGYGAWGVAMACGRWSSKGYWGLDVGAGLSPTRLAADIHETCRTGCNGGGSGGSDDDD